MKIDGREIDISNRDKVFFPGPGLSKGDVIDYYEQAAEFMVPHMRQYGVSMQRFPDGLKGEGFYNKDMPGHFPDWIRSVKVPQRGGGSFVAPIVDSKAALVFLADQAVLTYHLYLARADDLEHPDKMVFDVDPPEGAQDDDAVRRASLDLRDILHELDLEVWVQTTGSKGFHIVVPLDRKADFHEVRQFARDAALLLVRRRPETYTLEQRINKREGKIFLDVLRNAYGATAVSPYSVRAKPNATVAAPLDWDEVAGGASPRDWTIQNILRRLAQKKDPWADLMRHARSIASRKDRLDALLDRESG